MYGSDYNDYDDYENDPIGWYDDYPATYATPQERKLREQAQIGEKYDLQDYLEDIVWLSSRYGRLR